MIEVEVKVYASHEQIKNKMKNKKEIQNFVFSHTEKQKEQYFNDPKVDFAKTNEALRIRSVNGKQEITYKGKMIDNISKTRPEFNSPVDGYNMTQILLSLGYELSDIVEKTRDVYEYDNMILCFDNVKGLGEFLEVEIDMEDGSSSEDIKDATNKIFEFLESVGVGKEKSERRSYLELLIEKKKQNKTKE